MILNVQKSFEKDIASIIDKKLAAQIKAVITELEDAKTFSTIRNMKKMAAKGNYYRIRLGNYRIGIKIESDTISLLRFMHRKEIYKYFPQNWIAASLPRGRMAGRRGVSLSRNPLLITNTFSRKERKGTAEGRKEIHYKY